MKRFTEILSGSAVMLFHVALTAWLFCLSRLNSEFAEMSLNCLPLCAVLLLGYYLDMLMMRKGAPVPVFAAAQIAFVALAVWVFTQSVHLEPYKSGTVIMNCIIYCLGFLVADFVAWMPTNESGVLLRFDALAVMLIILLVLDELLILPAADTAMLMCAVCLVLMLLSAISMRSGRLAGRGRAVTGDPVVGRIALVVVFVLLAVLAVLVVMYATSGMKSFSEFCLMVINAVVAAVKAVLLWLYGLLEAFMLWLSQFAADVEMEAVGLEMSGTAAPEISGGEVGEMPGWIYPVLIVLAAAALVFIVYRLRHVRLGRVHFSVGNVQVQKRQSGLKKALLDALRRGLGALSFGWNCLRWRKTAPGLLAWVERRVEPAQRRRDGESGEAFLRRLSSCGFGCELSSALLTLADSVERSFYSPVPAAVPAPVYKTLRRGKFKTEKTGAD